MEFQEFLKTRPKYESLYLLEEFGKKEEIEKRVVQFGLRTRGKVLLYNEKTKYISEHYIYTSDRGYSILWNKRKIPYENFK